MNDSRRARSGTSGRNELDRHAGAGQTQPVDVIDAAGRSPLIDEAAQIWAEATAARDGHDQVPAYIGVRHLLWGQGTGEKLLLEAGRRLKAAGYASVELSVYADDHRATALYQRLGGQAVGPQTAHPKTGKPEQRYELRLKPV